VLEALQHLATESSEYLEVLERAYLGTQAVEPKHLICAIAMAASLLDHGTMAKLDLWLGRYVRTVSDHAEKSLVQVWTDIGDVAASVLHPSSVEAERTDVAVSRLFALLNSARSPVSADTRLLAGQMLLEHAFATNKTALIDVVVSLVEGESVMRAASSVAVARWFTCVGYVSFTRGDAESAKKAWREAQRVALSGGLRAAGFMAQIGLVRQLLDEQNLIDARLSIGNMRPAEGPGRSSQVLLYKHVLARCLLLEGQVGAAALQVDEALGAAKHLGLVDGELFLLTQQKAEILYAAGDHNSAEELVNWMLQRSKGTESTIQDINLQLMRAMSSTGVGQTEKLEMLALAFRKARALNFTRFLRSLPATAAQACLAALEANIEVDFVTNTIRQRKLTAPLQAGSTWPWHLRVQTLGHAQVCVDGKPLEFPGRTQGKPLELLLFLASVRDMRASNELIAGCLWSGEDPLRSAKSLETTTARLRKLLADDTLVQVSHGQTALDRRRVWSDWTYFGETARLLTAAATTVSAPDLDVPHLAKRLLATYEGAFMRTWTEASWISSRRHEASQRFVAAALAAHAAWSGDGDSKSVEAFLESALSHEPLSETLALRLMQGYAASDRVADALRIYRQLRHQMSITLGLRPGRSIEQLQQQLLGCND
jgi:DNA-binding SARP family transcriptional activator